MLYLMLSDYMFYGSFQNNQRAFLECEMQDVYSC
jgi:hypothetical protein